MQAILARVGKANDAERLLIVAALALLSALASTFVNLGRVELFDAPLLPPLFFGLVLALVVLAATGGRYFEAACIFIICVVAWICAFRTSAAAYGYIGQAFKFEKIPDRLFSGPDQVAFVLGVCGVLGGLVGSAILSFGLALISPAYRAFDKWGRTVTIGTVAGILLECNGSPVNLKLPIHVGSILPLFAVWQIGVAASIAYGLLPQTARSRSARTYAAASSDIGRSLGSFFAITAKAVPGAPQQTPEARAPSPGAAKHRPDAKPTKGRNAMNPSPQTAYILNFILPGAGSIYFGQPIVGTIFILGILLGLFMLFFGASAAMLGIVIILVSVVAALFTLGLSLIVGLPIGLIFLMMGAGPIVAFFIWLFSLLLSEFLVYRKANAGAAA